MIAKNEQWISELLFLRGWSKKDSNTFVKAKDGCKTVLVLPMTYLLNCKGSVIRHVERIEQQQYYSNSKAWRGGS